MPRGGMSRILYTRSVFTGAFWADFSLSFPRKFFYYFYLPAFLNTGLGLPRGNVHERDSGPMQGAIPTQSHNP